MTSQSPALSPLGAKNKLGLGNAKPAESDGRTILEDEPDATVELVLSGDRPPSPVSGRTQGFSSRLASERAGGLPSLVRSVDLQIRTSGLALRSRPDVFRVGS